MFDVDMVAVMGWAILFFNYLVWVLLLVAGIMIAFKVIKEVRWMFDVLDRM